MFKNLNRKDFEERLIKISIKKILKSLSKSSKRRIELSDELGIPKTTIQDYLKKLYNDNKITKFKKKNDKGIGRDHVYYRIV